VAALAGHTRVLGISNGGIHMACWCDDGRVYTWGCGSDGRMGHPGACSLSLSLSLSVSLSLYLSLSLSFSFFRHLTFAPTQNPRTTGICFVRAFRVQWTAFRDVCDKYRARIITQSCCQNRN